MRTGCDVGRPDGARGSLRRGSIGPASILLLVLITGASCVSVRLPAESLPAEPIALVHWEGRDATKRGELIAKAAEAGPPAATDSDSSPEREIAEIRAHLRGVERLELLRPLERHPGRLMLFWPRTGELERIDAAPPNAIPLAWSADHERLIFVSSHRDGREQLYEYHRVRRDLRPLTFGPAEHVAGDYEPPLEHLVVQRLERVGRMAETRPSLVRLSPAGGREEVIARDGPVGSLHVTPDGRRTVYQRVVARPRRDGPTTYESFVATRAVEADAEETVLLPGREPSLTPDGQWIVFASKSSSGYRLRRMRLDGTIRVPIGPGGSEERMPTVSPDGAFVAFIEGDRRRLVVRRFDGKLQRVLLSDGWSEFPVW